MSSTKWGEKGSNIPSPTSDRSRSQSQGSSASVSRRSDQQQHHPWRSSARPHSASATRKLPPFLYDEAYNNADLSQRQRLTPGGNIPPMILSSDPSHSTTSTSYPTVNSRHPSLNRNECLTVPSDQCKISSSSHSSVTYSHTASGSGSASRSRRADSASGNTGVGTLDIGSIAVRASIIPSISSRNMEIGFTYMSGVSSKGFTTTPESVTHGSLPLRQHPLPLPDYPDLPQQEMTSAVTSIDIKRLLSKPALPQSTPYHPKHPFSLSSKSLPATSSADLDPEKGLGRADVPKPAFPASPSLQAPTCASGARAVLKRKPSGPRLPAARSAPAVGTPRRLASNANLTIDAHLSNRALPSDTNSSSSSLTPAGAVAEAYNQEEQKQDDFSQSGSSSAEGPKTLGGMTNLMPTPSYSLGGTTGRVVAVGAPNPDCYYGDVHTPRYHTKDHSSNLGKSLTKKVSTRWRKAATGLRGDEDSPDSVERVRGAAGSGGRSASLPKERANSSGHDQSLGLQLPRGDVTASSQKGTYSRAWRTDTVEGDVRAKPGKLIKTRHDREKEEAGGKIWKLMKRISTGGLREKYQSDIAPPVPALPRSFVSPDVHPSAEAERVLLSRFMSSRSSMSATPTKNPRSSSQGGSSMASSSNGHSDPSKGPGPRRSTTTGSISSHISSDLGSSRFFHRSQSTRSSSSSYAEEFHASPPLVPNAKIGQHIIPPSELHLMNMQIEAESAVSPPLAPQRSRSALTNDSVPPPDLSPEATRPSLPFPPRRPVTPNYNGPKSEPSPELPLFSNAGAINTFKRRATSERQGTDETETHDRPHLRLQMPQTEFGVPSLATSPLSSGLEISRGELISFSAHSTTPRAKTRSSEDNYDGQYYDPRSGKRHSNASTLRQRSNTFNIPHPATPRRPTTADSQATARNNIKPPVSVKSPLNFRALDSRPAMPLTAKEKADIWNDLLEKSDLAGGTLHIGEQALMSDQMSQMGLESRLSNYTELTDIP